MKHALSILLGIALLVFCGFLILSALGVILTVIGFVLGLLGMVLPFLIGAAIIGYVILLLIDNL